MSSALLLLLPLLLLLHSNSYTWCCQWKQMFYVKLLVSSIHSCIHHHLDRNTARDTDIMVSRLLHAGSILLLPTKDRSFIHPRIFTQHDVQTWVQREAGNLLYSFMHPSSPGSKYRKRYGLNGPQATAWWCSPPGSIPTNNEHLLHSIHSTNANMYSGWSCWSALYFRAFIITCIQIHAETWTK